MLLFSVALDDPCPPMLPSCGFFVFSAAHCDSRMIDKIVACVFLVDDPLVIRAPPLPWHCRRCNG